MERYLGLSILALTILLFSTGVYGQDFSHLEEILAKIDQQSSFIDTDFSSLMTMVSEDPEKGIEKTVVRQFRRDDGDKFLLILQEPFTQKGQGYLMEGDNLWFYDPSSRKFAHSSMKESFQGTDARNADFGQWSYSSSYKILSVEEGSLGQYSTYIVELEGIEDTVPFPLVKLWIAKEAELILKSEEYSLNNRLMRTGLYPKYAKAGKTLIPSQIIFIDELIEGKKTQIAISEISTSKIPDHVFTKAYIERVSR